MPIATPIPEALARLDAGLEFENFGVPAYGLDQAFLRYQREGRPTHPQIVVIGFMEENIFRDVTCSGPSIGRGVVALREAALPAGPA